MDRKIWRLVGATGFAEEIIFLLINLICSHLNEKANEVFYNNSDYSVGPDSCIISAGIKSQRRLFCLYAGGEKFQQVYYSVSPARNDINQGRIGKSKEEYGRIYQPQYYS